MDRTNQSFEGHHNIRIALKQCKLVERSLALILIQVNRLKTKYCSFNNRTPTILNITAEDDAGLAKYLKSFGNDSGGKKTDARSVGKLYDDDNNNSTNRLRSIKTLNNEGVKQQFHLVQIKQNVASVLAKIESLTRIYLKKSLNVEQRAATGNNRRNQHNCDVYKDFHCFCIAGKK